MLKSKKGKENEYGTYDESHECLVRTGNSTAGTETAGN
jgi:hypothetical protein